ncbi:hypothetical protein [Xanthobacter sp. 91]|uniref:hypothetical protein n=1 Tax=Xanthobacter sp. 91 TaxID=1117244 RepID=UPI0012DCE45D|nr:hypothetical protein [Xanthobacter sp. 91]
MSTGLSLIKVLCRQGARTAFQQVDPNHFIAEERPSGPLPGRSGAPRSEKWN